MLWDIVYSFFVQYIFGGWLFIGDSNEFFGGLLGGFVNNNLEYDNNLDTSSLYFKFDDVAFSGGIIEGNGPLYMSIGNYLSFIATIITMIVILVLCAQLIKKIYNMCAHVIG